MQVPEEEERTAASACIAPDAAAAKQEQSRLATHFVVLQVLHDAREDGIPSHGDRQVVDGVAEARLCRGPQQRRPREQRQEQGLGSSA